MSKVLDHIEYLEQQLAEIQRGLSYTREIAEQEAKQKRLDRKEAARLLEYDKNYIYTMQPQPPFSDGYITYANLEEFISKYKPARLKRLRKNFEKNN